MGWAALSHYSVMLDFGWVCFFHICCALSAFSVRGCCSGLVGNSNVMASCFFFCWLFLSPVGTQYRVFPSSSKPSGMPGLLIFSPVGTRHCAFSSGVHLPVCQHVLLLQGGLVEASCYITSLLAGRRIILLASVIVKSQPNINLSIIIPNQPWRQYT